MSVAAGDDGADGRGSGGGQYGRDHRDSRGRRDGRDGHDRHDHRDGHDHHDHRGGRDGRGRRGRRGRRAAALAGGGAARRRPHRPTALLAALLLACVTAVIACRATDTDGITPVPQLLAFWPWLLAPCVLALLLSALARSAAGLAWALAALGTVAWFTDPHGRVSSEPRGAPVARVRVLASNVEHGRGTPALTRAVRRERPDIVFVEECDGHCFRVLHDAFGGPAAAGRSHPETGPRGTYPYRREARARGARGAAILSRYPLTPEPAVPGTMAMPGATATVAGRPVRLQLAHPMPPLPGGLDRWRADLASLRTFAAGAAAEHRSTILAGDFNATQDHAAFRRILDTGLRDGARLAGAGRSPSWPARTTPALGAQIDHVIVSRDFSARGARFLKLPDTDHRALLADLVLHGTRRPSHGMEPASPDRP